MVNLVRHAAPVSGPERIIIASHFDTKLFNKFRSWAQAMPVEHGGAARTGRVLKDRQRPFTIELLFLDGEGSRRRVDSRPIRRTGAATTCRTPRTGGTLISIKAFDPARHDRRQRSEHAPRAELDAWLPTIIGHAANVLAIRASS
jgi:hypothetical protein